MAGRLMLGISGEAKRTEQLATARRVLTAHVERARERGRPPLPKTVYGYRRDTIPGTALKAPPVVDEAQAEVVCCLFRWYVEGYSLGWIVKELYRRGVPSPGGGRGGPGRWCGTSSRTPSTSAAGPGARRRRAGSSASAAAGWPRATAPARPSGTRPRTGSRPTTRRPS
jgi:hypothetical protein